MLHPSRARRTGRRRAPQNNVSDPKTLRIQAVYTREAATERRTISRGRHPDATRDAHPANAKNYSQPTARVKNILLN